MQVRANTTLGNGEWSDLVVVPTPVPSSEDESSTPVAAIVVGVVVGIGVVIIVMVVAVCVISRYKNRIKIYDHTVCVHYINDCAYCACVCLYACVRVLCYILRLKCKLTICG